jgi:hypothetical protein
LPCSGEAVAKAPQLEGNNAPGNAAGRSIVKGVSRSTGLAQTAHLITDHVMIAHRIHDRIRRSADRRNRNHKAKTAYAGTPHMPTF